MSRAHVEQPTAQPPHSQPDVRHTVDVQIRSDSRRRQDQSHPPSTVEKGLGAVPEESVAPFDGSVTNAGSW